MRILVLITALTTGGAEMALFRTLHTLRKKGVDALVVSILAIPEKPVPTLGAQVCSLGMARAQINMQGLLRLRKIVRDYQPELIQGWMYHSNVLAHLARLLASGGKRIPLATAVRGSLTAFHQEKWLTRAVIHVDAFLSRWSDRIFYVSQLAHQQHNEFGYAAAQSMVIPNGFDSLAFRPDLQARIRIRRELGIPQEALVVGMIASWQPVKNHQGFMAAAAMLAKQRPDVHFVCAGRRVAFDNPEAAAVVPDAIRAQVHLLGERRDIAALNAAFDVAVNASHAEAFPNVVGEAMACGVPMVVTDVGDSAWILDGNGEVVPPGDAGALAQALAHLLKLCPAERQALGQRGRQRIVENFSLETVAERYLCEWSKLCARPM